VDGAKASFGELGMIRRLSLLLVLAGTLAAGSARAEDPALADPADEAPAAEAPAAASAEDEAPVANENRDLRTVEQEVNSLKERVFRSKATLQLLRELVIEGASLGSRLVLWHVDRMGPAYSTESIQYFLDGKNIFAKLDPSGSLNETDEFQVVDRSLPPGPHSLQVNVGLRGNGYGVFSYLKTYTFKVQSSYTFEIDDGRMTALRVVLDDKGGLVRRFVDRPSVSYEERGEVLRDE
jgi:hypothetical protein